MKPIYPKNGHGKHLIIFYLCPAFFAGFEIQLWDRGGEALCPFVNKLEKLLPLELSMLAMPGWQ